METLNITNLLEENRKEITDLYNKMVKVEYFADTFPCFKEIILKRKMTWDEHMCNNFWDRYKWVYFSSDIRRIHYNSDQTQYKWHITNFVWDYNCRVFNIYVNTYTLYDSHEKYWLDELDKPWVFFFDKLNSTFYINDHYIETFLEEYIVWYENAKKSEAEARKEERKLFYEKELEKLNNA